MWKWDLVLDSGVIKNPNYNLDETNDAKSWCENTHSCNKNGTS